MTIESRRKELQANRRRWGDTVSYVPYSVCPPPPSNDHVRENINPSAAVPPITDPDPLDDNSDPLAPLAGPVGPTYLQIPIPVNNTMISTKGWSLDSLINQSINFHHVRRVSALSSSLSQIINDHEESGRPLVIEDCHKHCNWPKDHFTLDSFTSTTSDKITVRNVHDSQDTILPLSDFITKSRSISAFAEAGEQERFYGKDADCPKHWEDWLQNAGVVPQSLLSGGPQDLFRYRPHSSRIETLMCYLGVGDTFTPCHKDLCASSGQNLMCHTENDGSSFWFMTESASAPEVAKFFHSLGRELDHEDYVITVGELSKARFKVYILEQKLGDLVLVPPRSAHQVVNFGGITVKTSWSRMTLKGLVAAYHHELPIYRRVCRPETYRVKSTIHYVLLGLIKDLQIPSQRSNAPNLSDKDEKMQQVSNIQTLLAVYDLILAEEFETHREEMSRRSTSNEVNSIDDEHIICDFCGADIFQSFFECRTCVEADSAEGGYVVCPGCYAEGRSCKCQIMQRMQRRQFKLLVDTRAEAIQVVDMYERCHGRTFQPSNDYCDLNNYNYPRIFSAACVLLDIRKKMKSEKVCNQSRPGNSHNVPFSWALTCKMCHHAKCFSHILSEHKTHSVEALLLHNGDDTHHKYHHNHIVGRKTRLENSAADSISNHPRHRLAYYAINFTYCKPIKPQFMKLGWYDLDAHSSYISDDQESLSPVEMGPTPIPETISAEFNPIDVQPPTSKMPNFEVKSTRKRKRKVYVLVPPAPYPLPPHPLSDQNSDSQSSTQAVSSPSVPLSIRHRPGHVVQKSGRIVSSLQEKRKLPKVLAASKPSTLTLSDIGISIPTVRKPGSFIIHAREFVPRIRTPAEEPPTIDRPVVGPIKPSTVRTSKPPYVANPVTGQVITRGSIAGLRFKKSKPNKPNLQPSSNDVAISAGTTSGTQEGVLKASQPELQPMRPMLPSGTPDVLSTDSLADSFAEAVMHRVGIMLCQKSLNSGPLMNSFDASSNSNRSPQAPYDHPQQYNGPPQHYNGPPQRYNGPPQHYNGPPQNYSGPSPPYYNNYLNSHIQHAHPRRLNNQFPYHPASYPMANEPQFDQGSRRSPHNPMQFAGKMGHVNHQPQNEYNTRNKMHVQSTWFKSPYKKRKYGPQAQEPQNRTQFSNNHRSQGPRPPQGPRGHRYYESPPKYSTSGRVEYHDSVERSRSKDHERLSSGTSGEETPSRHYQSQSAHGRESYRRQYSFNQESMAPNSRDHGGIDPFIEPKREGSNPRHCAQNHDATVDVTDVDSNDITRFETPSPMTDLLSTPRDGIYRDDLVMDEDDTHEAGTLMADQDPVPVVRDQGNEQIWEDGYEISEERVIEALVPESTPPPQLALAAGGSSIFNVADDCMADVTTNPWTS